MLLTENLVLSLRREKWEVTTLSESRSLYLVCWTVAELLTNQVRGKKLKGI